MPKQKQILLLPVAIVLYNKMITYYNEKSGYYFPANPTTSDFYDVGDRGSISNDKPIGNFFVNKLNSGDRKSVYHLDKKIRDKNETLLFSGKYPDWYAQALGFDDIAQFIKSYRSELTEVVYEEQLNFLNGEKENTSPYQRKKLFYHCYTTSIDGIVQANVLGIYDNHKQAQMLLQNQVLLEGDTNVEGPFLSFSLKEVNSSFFIKRSIDIKCFVGLFDSFSNKNILPFVYSGILDNDNAVAGEGLLIKIDENHNYQSVEEVELPPQSEAVDLRIVSQIQNKILSTPRTTFNALEKLPRNYYSKAKKLIGTYRSYILSRLESCLRESVIRINEDLTADCKSNQNNYYKGFVEISSSGKFYLVLNFKRLENESKEQFNIILSLPSDGAPSPLYGVFSGVSIESSIMGGREVFVKESEDPALYDHLDAKIYEVGTNAYQEIVDQHDFILPFLAGDDDKAKYLDNTHRLRSADFNKKILFKSKISDYDIDRMKKIAGYYKCYWFDSSNRIICSIWNLREDFTYEIKSLTHSCSGVITIKGDIMQVLSEEEDRFGDRSLFFIGSYYEFESIVGLYSTISITGMPIVGKKVLIKTTKTMDLKPEVIKRSTPGYDILNSTYKGLGTFLLGSLDNHILCQHNVNAEAFIKKEDYGQLYFDAACYLAAFESENNENKDKIFTHLKSAVKNGFKDKEQLAQRMKSEILKKYLEKIDTEKWLVLN